MPFTFAPVVGLVAVIVVAGIGLLDPRVALAAAALAAVGVTRLLFGGMEGSAEVFGIVAVLIALLPVSAGYDIRRACRS